MTEQDGQASVLELDEEAAAAARRISTCSSMGRRKSKRGEPEAESEVMKALGTEHMSGARNSRTRRRKGVASSEGTKALSTRSQRFLDEFDEEVQDPADEKDPRGSFNEFDDLEDFAPNDEVGSQTSSTASSRGSRRLHRTETPQLLQVPVPKIMHVVAPVRAASKFKSLGKQVFESEHVKRLAEKRRAAQKELGSLTNSFLESDYFVNMVNQAFDECDIDGNGSIEASELYAGILLLYHNINRIPWGGRKPPPTREQVLVTMKKYDFDGSNTLDRDEFLALCQDLCSNIAVDVSKRVLLVLLVFPSMALPCKRLTEGTLRVVGLGAVSNVLAAVPDHLFTSLFVAIMVTVMPYIEQNLLQPSHTWEALSKMRKRDIKMFRRQRRKKLESSKIRKYFNDKSESTDFVPEL